MEQRMEANDVPREFNKAKAEGRQPVCPYCHKPLEIGQFFTVYTHWSWDKKDKNFKQDDTDWEPEKPFCNACEEKDWDFLNSG